ncbi:MAG: adenylate/guanylate cyclase domain-containing protein, partial [Deltaproteobacteria bacterium]|nr:adenylate/guanylate cyclase domain-containing protein [Deltaproteobacteria bacterium]
DLVAVKGKTRGVRIFELLGQKDEVDQKILAFAKNYEEAFSLYESRQFRRALELLREIEAEHPGDLSVRRLSGLCKDYDQGPPPEDWDGVSRFTVK